MFTHAFEPAIVSAACMRHVPKNVLLNQGWHCFPKQTLSQLFSITHPCQVVLAGRLEQFAVGLYCSATFIYLFLFFAIGISFCFNKTNPNLINNAINTTPAGLHL